MARKPDKPGAAVVTLEGERERTIALLTEHFAQDNLTMDDFEKRVESAYKASSIPALREITKDFVRQAPPPGQVPAVSSDAARQAILSASEFTPERERISAIMSSVKRRGVWRPARFVDLRCIMTETELDLTQAVLSPGVTEIRLFAFMAAVKIIVAPGVRVVLQPSSFMGEVSDETMDAPAIGSGAPVVRITGRVIMTEMRAVVRRRELAEGETPTA